jgi:hypothetical protein
MTLFFERNYTTECSYEGASAKIITNLDNENGNTLNDVHLGIVLVMPLME